MLACTAFAVIFFYFFREKVVLLDVKIPVVLFCLSPLSLIKVTGPSHNLCLSGLAIYVFLFLDPRCL